MNQYTKPLPWLKSVLFTGAIATTAAFSLFTPMGDRSVFAALEDSPKNVVDEVWQIVNSDYVDHTFNNVDWQSTRQQLLSRNYTSKQEAYDAIRKALEPLGDPYTRFLDPDQFKSLTSQTSGELSGVGIRLGVNEKTQKLTVVEPIENSPAAKADIKAGDEIVAIDGKSASGMTAEEASALIRGELGTDITLKISRAEKGIFEVKLTRARIELPAVHSSVKQEGKLKVGYIVLDEFSSHAAEQMERTIKNLNSQKVDSYVLDLRGNPGGLLHASIEIARMWIDNGEIVHTVDRKGGEQKFSANQSALTQLPLAVLVDGNSASASEILTGALKDNKRATIIGSRTFGKAVVQSVHSLSDGSGLAVTISRYYPPSGTDINHKGIVPDIKLDLSREQQQRLSSNPELRATGDDPQYNQAVSFLQNTTLSRPTTTQPVKPISIR
ncbi:MAG TPA: peptidase S41 [Cyanobacteria bacterium UBA11149]|nr:peptidase S41 [Cyanobacteria bacterium UBA11367]HBE57081.1 peptidase S41 [Cyanobacteria bacterium UBA11366]HBK64712.1 peptidase S41 [Cyanobacteria bacterium UBA11166]HBR74418.1 peptidase S41 [Cyanobacteria bacterium UBA11159]HBS69803.1 peptidase S41 [Cyanobacteria bacterium UBA11153]HBW90156.1 peptidase S41 [Cyanobacteria bacterium UBA11149]HCA97526.1 peptidase S41 [Cyanobacteria bacterium UBA9226]